MEITTSDEFEQALAAAIEAAIEEGVDIRGAWQITADNTATDWEVEIVELANGRD